MREAILLGPGERDLVYHTSFLLRVSLNHTQTLEGNMAPRLIMQLSMREVMSQQSSTISALWFI